MPERTHVVILIHGIRTQAEWAQRAAAILETDPTIRARPTRFQFFDVLRFLIPWFALRDGPVRRITRLIRTEMSKNPERLSIVAHSFGTYVVAKILESETDLRFHRIILCGSIIPDGFEWEKYTYRLDPKAQKDWLVVNDCGMRDLWPVFAQSITWGYGASGRFGFGHVNVKDRFFPGGHSDFFSDQSITDYWLPYLSAGAIREGELRRATNPWWVSVLTVFRLRYVLVLVAAMLLVVAVPRIAKLRLPQLPEPFFVTVPRPPPHRLGPNPVASPVVKEPTTSAKATPASPRFSLTKSSKAGPGAEAKPSGVTGQEKSTPNTTNMASGSAEGLIAAKKPVEPETEAAAVAESSHPTPSKAEAQPAVPPSCSQPDLQKPDRDGIIAALDCLATRLSLDEWEAARSTLVYHCPQYPADSSLLPERQRGFRDCIRQSRSDLSTGNLMKIYKSIWR